jgi:DNA replication initiation complex subunit (GINS family)
VANRNNSAIELSGIKIGPFAEGKEYEVKYWIAAELKKAGIARIRMDEPLDLMLLNKIHWKERVQASQKLTSLPENFYPKLRRYLNELGEEAIKKPEKRSDYEKAKNLSVDIVRMRLKKIVSLSSSGRNQTGQILRGLTKEEKYVYDCLHKITSEWQNEILTPQGGDKT